VGTVAFLVVAARDGRSAGPPRAPA
jgi:hypothetical protein